MTTNEELRALAGKASSGPWKQSEMKTWVCRGSTIIAEAVPLSEQGHVVPRDRDLEQRRANAAFIAAANPERVLALLDEVERLRRFARSYEVRRQKGVMNTDPFEDAEFDAAWDAARTTLSEGQNS